MFLAKCFNIKDVFSVFGSLRIDLSTKVAFLWSLDGFLLPEVSQSLKVTAITTFIRAKCHIKV